MPKMEVTVLLLKTKASKQYIDLFVAITLYSLTYEYKVYFSNNYHYYTTILGKITFGDTIMTSEVM